MQFALAAVDGGRETGTESFMGAVLHYTAV